MAEQGMIAPFEPQMVRRVEDLHVISYGTGPYGYDIRLDPNDFRIFRHIPGEVVNPKAFSEENLEQAQLKEDGWGQFFIIPANSYALGVAVEHLNVPKNITVLCIGKSTYARAGIIANLTPAECEWSGHLTLEFSNASSADCRVYANEGIVQLLFMEGEPCEISYATRPGGQKYQDQPKQVVLPRV